MSKWFIFIIICFVAYSNNASAKPAGFKNWLESFKQQAIESHNISEQTVDAALSNVSYKPKVVRLDRNQPETTITLKRYMQKVVSKSRLEKGKKNFKAYNKTLNKISKQYGVPEQFIVALWGIETFYGKITGGSNVPEVLATLAYDGRRKDFFKSELISALQVIDGGHIHPYKMSGSWAGAMGQCQFMPSSFQKYAVDYNNDGRTDIWNSLEDVFASTANYLHQHGWNPEINWGMKVKLPANFNRKYLGLEKPIRMEHMADLGVKKMNGSVVKGKNLNVYLIQPDGVKGQAYLVTENFKIIMKWNKSQYFAVSVGTMADYFSNKI